MKSILSMRDVPQLHCGPHNPLAVLIACYTGAMDAPQGCLAEDLLLAKEGPVAVIAATRVTMPYGNTIMGCELLRACFQDRPEVLGDVVRLAQRRVLAPATKDPSSKDQLRMTLDGMAEALSPPPVDLVGERREHVLMYQLIGDPLLRLHRPAAEVAQSKAAATRVK
jgi:Peptidase family C25